ncbi:hypothetical protein HJFPF1_08577 [Paramyrothecium foliicola]|nr:hypothetical protein HJFPF1_08577 [Paramyrothecium foliicola]
MGPTPHGSRRVAYHPFWDKALTGRASRPLVSWISELVISNLGRDLNFNLTYVAAMTSRREVAAHAQVSTTKIERTVAESAVHSPLTRGVARKIRCDRTLPSCTGCVKGGKQCPGYGMRLFWPRSDDKRRAVVAPPSGARIAQYEGVEFIDTTFQDVRLHDRLSGEKWNANEDVEELEFAPILTNPIRWIPYEMTTTESDLFEYFESVASSALLTMGQDSTAIRETIIRTALLANTPAAVGVFKSLLAVSALHRYGFRDRAAQLQISALKALQQRQLTENEMTAQEIIQQIAAGMLLCSFEIQVSAHAKSKWPWFICGSRKLVSVAVANQLAARESDFVVLQGWVHYHDVFSRFGMRHWIGHGSPLENYTRDVGFPGLLSQLCDIPEMPYPLSPPHEILHLFSVIFESVLEQHKPLYHSDAYRKHLAMLQRRLKDVNLEDQSTGSTPIVKKDHIIPELYRLASLIYLERSSGNISADSIEIAEWVATGSQLFEKLGTCSLPLLLFIFGLEARSDAERMKILRLISKTERETQARNLNTAKAMIRMSWVQDDLGTSYIDYVEKINMLLSSSKALPTFL